MIEFHLKVFVVGMLHVHKAGFFPEKVLYFILKSIDLRKIHLLLHLGIAS